MQPAMIHVVAVVKSNTVVSFPEFTAYDRLVAKSSKISMCYMYIVEASLIMCSVEG